MPEHDPFTATTFEHLVGITPADRPVILDVIRFVNNAFDEDNVFRLAPTGVAVSLDDSGCLHIHSALSA
jgi:hypothetical protein